MGLNIAVRLFACSHPRRFVVPSCSMHVAFLPVSSSSFMYERIFLRAHTPRGIDAVAFIQCSLNIFYLFFFTFFLSFSLPCLVVACATLISATNARI